MKTLKVKSWFIEKVQIEALRYNMIIDKNIDRECGETLKEDENGCYTVYVEELKETEKAIQVKLATGHIEGSTKGYTTWIPKSVIA